MAASGFDGRQWSPSVLGKRRRESSESSPKKTLHLMFPGSPAALTAAAFDEAASKESREVIEGSKLKTGSPVRLSHYRNDIMKRFEDMENRISDLETSNATLKTESDEQKLELAEQRPWVQVAVDSYRDMTVAEIFLGLSEVLGTGTRGALENLNQGQKVALRAELHRELFDDETYMTLLRNVNAPNLHDGSLLDEMLTAGETRLSTVVSELKAKHLSKHGVQLDWWDPQDLEVRKLAKEEMVTLIDRRNEQGHPLELATRANAELVLQDLKSRIMSPDNPFQQDDDWKLLVLLGIGMSEKVIQRYQYFNIQKFESL